MKAMMMGLLAKRELSHKRHQAGADTRYCSPGMAPES
jgi:hypothetical protein